MNYRDHIVALTGLNSDDDPRYFQPGEYEEARNVRIGAPQQEGTGGLAETMISTKEYNLPVFSGESFVTISILGAAEDKEYGREYILAYLSTSSGGSIIKRFVIYKHDVEAEQYKIIFYGDSDTWNIKSFAISGARFYNPKIVNRSLIFSDNVNDIRMIDVDKAENTIDAGIDKKVVQWQDNTTYVVDQFVFYKDKVYKVILTNGTDYTPPDEDSGVHYQDTGKKVEEVYLNMTEPRNFTFSALPPLIAPVVNYQSDTTIKTNHLRGSIWQFTYRYVYLDYRKSTYAPPSIVPPPSQEETMEGKPVADPSHNNSINIELNTGNEEVRSIEVVGRSSADPATWFLIDKINIINDRGERIYDADTSIYISFYNNNAITVVDSSEIYIPFSYVPIKAKHMELVEGNRVVFGNITEGYPKINSNVKTGITWESLSGITTETTYLTIQDTSHKSSPVDNLYLWLLKFNLPSLNPGECIFKVRIRKSSESSYTEATYSYNGTDAYPSTVVTGLKNAIDSVWGSGTTATCFETDSYSFCAFQNSSDGDVDPYTDWGKEFYYQKSTVTKVNKYPTLKTGAVQTWAMAYRDKAGRLSPVIGGGEITAYIPFSTESSSNNIDQRPKIDFTIYHKPPDWADSYEILYGGNKSISWFLQLLGYNFAKGKKDHDDNDITGANDSGEDYRIRIKKAQTNTRDRFNNWSVEEYSWEKGDRIRIIGKVSAAGSVTEENGYIYDAEVTGVFADTDDGVSIGEAAGDHQYDWVYFKILSEYPLSPTYDSGSATNKLPDTLWVEIYRPVKEVVGDTSIYYTTGMTFKVLEDANGNKYHAGDTDQVIDSNGIVTTPATVHNNSHDGWKYIRNFVDVYNGSVFKIWAESQYPSDYYVTQYMTSQGIPIADTGEQIQNRLSKRLRHGGIMNVGSQLNYIAKFDYDDYVDLKEEDGPIEGLRYIGFVLKAIQYYKETSIYISRKEAFNADGSPYYMFTDKVFGTVRREIEKYGTQNPESVVSNNRHLYYWDQFHGAYVRSAANGIIPISDLYKMRKWFRKKADQFEGVPYEERYIQSVFSTDNDELIVVFGARANTAYDEAIVFNETENRWKYKLDILNSFYTVLYSVGKRLFSLHGLNYKFYEWWKGDTYLSIHGEQKEGKLIVYSKADPLASTMFKSITVYQSGDTPQFNGISVPAGMSECGDEMKTSVFDANIKRREGIYYCQILRDENTPGTQTTQEKRLNGRVLRGVVLKINMKFTKTDAPVLLFSLLVNGTKSERSK